MIRNKSIYDVETSSGMTYVFIFVQCTTILWKSIKQTKHCHYSVVWFLDVNQITFA